MLQNFPQSMTTTAEPETQTTTKPLHDFINRTKLILKKEKVYPIDLKRAIFLSDIFEEKENHLKFTKILQKIRLESKKIEDQRMAKEQKECQRIQRENDKKIFQSKLLLGRRLKEEYGLLL